MLFSGAPGTILRMVPVPPDEPLRSALRRLGERGVRAERFLDSAYRQLSAGDDDPVAPQHAPYALREALMANRGTGGIAPARHPRGGGRTSYVAGVSGLRTMRGSPRASADSKTS